MRVMIRHSAVLIIGIAALASCSDEDAFDEETSGTGSGLPGGTSSSGMEMSSTSGSTDSEPPDSSGPSGPLADQPIDCSPAWTTTWIGSPCSDDYDCAYDGGRCILESEGFPCGTCTLDCTGLCPDSGDAPITYCVNGSDMGLSDNGHCLSKCDEQTIPNAEGCRDGYVCNALDRYDESSVDAVCIPREFDDGIDPVREIDHEFLIEYLGGSALDALDYPDDMTGFQSYLHDVGVLNTTAEELVTPNNDQAAMECGYAILLPPRSEWEKAAALALFTDVLTEEIGEDIFVRNWWRPPCYNELVGGAAGSDHLDSDAYDLDFSSSASRAIAQKFLCETFWKEKLVAPGLIDTEPLNMSIGLGLKTIHLGVLSMNGRRSWFYDSYLELPNSGDCWE